MTFVVWHLLQFEVVDAREVIIFIHLCIEKTSPKGPANVPVSIVILRISVILILDANRLVYMRLVQVMLVVSSGFVLRHKGIEDEREDHVQNHEHRAEEERDEIKMVDIASAIFDWHVDENPLHNLEVVHHREGEESDERGDESIEVVHVVVGAVDLKPPKDPVADFIFDAVTSAENVFADILSPLSILSWRDGFRRAKISVVVFIHEFLGRPWSQK